MKVYLYEDSLENILSEEKPIIFLAGPTIRRGSQSHLGESWRVEAIKEFERQGFDGVLIVPEFKDPDRPNESDEYERWIPSWEFTGLCASDVNMFWIPRTKELIGLTTNCEFGYWIGYRAPKVVYGRPADSYRNKYLDLMWEFNEMTYPICETLEDTVKTAITNSAILCRILRTRPGIKVDSPYGKF